MYVCVMRYMCVCVCVCARAGQLDYIHLVAPFVAVRNKEVNLTAVLWPGQVGTVTYIWWIGNSSEVGRTHCTHTHCTHT